MGRLLSYILAVALSLQAILAAGPPECSPSQKCPKDKPCCSQYGQCGIGAYCLGGCDPISSNSLDACVPEPVCESKTYHWDNLDSVAPNTKYLGNASEADWVSSGQPLSHDGQLILTMAPKTVGTLLACNHNVWFGKISAKLKTSRGQGVVTAFILLSDVKDEIDYEFIGADLNTAQTNFYFQGITDYTNTGNESVEDTFGTFHTYEIDWTPDSITWSIDGQVKRVKKRSDTWNATDHKFHYPQTPSRVQLSLWPAGLPSNGQGTIDWAGGLVDWNSQDIKTYGYYYAIFDEVTIQCYDPPPGANIKGSKSYIYTDPAGTNDTVEITDKDTVLKSFLGSGTDMNADYPSASSSGGPAPTDINVIPGLSGGGPGTNGQRPADSSSATKPGATPGSNGFSQGGGSGGSKGSSGAAPQNEQMLKGSLFAVLVAVVVLVTM